jgi:hypothetical protein
MRTVVEQCLNFFAIPLPLNDLRGIIMQEKRQIEKVSTNSQPIAECVTMAGSWLPLREVCAGFR